MDSHQDVLRSKVFRIRLFGQDSLVGVWAGMVIMGDTPCLVPGEDYPGTDEPSHVPYRYP